MTTFLFTYRKPQGTPRPDAERIAAWTAWFGAMGDALVDHGNPIFESTTVGSTTDTEIGGYSLIEADSLDDALALTDGCPFLGIGGGVEVGQLTPVTHLPDGSAAPATSASSAS